ncbi:uncharacterized protein [Fopius arisanus]|uniref:Peptidase aspartic putative domain-containing protein n=1 Tax=Fopius arisanus TaxID=64838 RepID=A0A9R1UAD9_9HYME|nr:PREDICTED: uncharacterized protein LOC105272616 [Fopius arisanus]
MASFEATISLNQSPSAFIERIYKELLTEEAKSLTISNLQSKLDILETYWEKFESTHEKLIASSGKIEGVLELPYFKDKCFDFTIGFYHEARGTLNQLIDKKGVSDSSRRSLASGTAQPTYSKRYLPEISLPKFGGAYADWRSFRDLFASLVGSNTDLSNVEKMHYLRTSLSGESAQRIADLTISDESFSIAWDQLLSRYENKRLLISAHLEQLLSPPAMTAHSAKELNALLTTVSEALNALEALGSPTAQWDQVIVHTVSQRLSSKLREAWEVKVGSSSEYPSFKDFKEFLTGRARAMESIEINSTPRATTTKPSTVSSSRQAPSAKVHHGAAQPTQRSRPAQRSAPTGKVTYPCSTCEADHYLTSCSSFRQLTVPARREVVEKPYLCYNCLGRHSVRDCRSKTTCQYCGKLHHSMLHSQPSNQPARPAQQRQQTSSAPQKPVPVVHQGERTEVKAQPAGPTQPPSVPANHSTSWADQLGLFRLKTQLRISGIGDAASGPALGKVQLTIQSTHSNFQLRVSAYALGQLTNSLPTFSSSQLTWDHLEELQLADPDFLTPAPIDILLGADVYGQLILPQVITNGPNSPSAQLTQLGWIVFGPTEGPGTTQEATSHLAVTNDDLNELLTKFWVQEEIPGTSEVQLTEEEAQSFLKEYKELDHMRRVPGSSISSALSDQLTGGRNAPGMTLAHEVSASGGLRIPGGTWSPQAQSTPEYFFPHHVVLRASSETTKLRVVFNGSNKTSSGQSLNDIMHTGEKLQKDISDVLLFSRRKRLIFMTDITKMFRQIQVHPEDWPLQQIFWNDSNGDIVPYQLTTVTYGTRSAPFLSIRVLHQLVEDEGLKYPLAVEPLMKGRYVDDICGGADSDEELLRTAHQVTQLCLSGGFPLAKWHSNSPALLTSLRPDSTSQEQRSIEDSLTKILGVSWHPGTDNFKFSVAQPETSSISKRIILSETAQLFDPLGFLAPVVVRAKILLQALWVEKLGWDEPVSPMTAHRWRQFREELTQLSEVTIPRWLGLLKDSIVEVHGFSDASQVAMSTVVYLKIFNGDKQDITLVCSKTKVAPLKRLTIPRLELTAALLLAKLTKYVKDQLNLTNATTYLWTDSSVTLTWISSHSSRLTGVWSQARRILQTVRLEVYQRISWLLISCGGQGRHGFNRTAHHGPHALEKDLNVDLEEKPGVLLHLKAQPIALWDLIDRFSSLNRLLRVTAICRRFIARLRKVPHASLQYPLTLGDLEEARILWIKLTQAAHFKDQLRSISRGERFSKSHPLIKLTPFIDHQGVLRVGGRLKFAHIGPESRNQAIIPKESRLAQLLIGQAHLRTLHEGTQLTLRQLRSSYWILGGRAPRSMSRGRDDRSELDSALLCSNSWCGLDELLNTGIRHRASEQIKLTAEVEGRLMRNVLSLRSPMRTIKVKKSVVLFLEHSACASSQAQLTAARSKVIVAQISKRTADKNEQMPPG